MHASGDKIIIYMYDTCIFLQVLHLHEPGLDSDPGERLSIIRRYETCVWSMFEVQFSYGGSYLPVVVSQIDLQIFSFYNGCFGMSELVKFISDSFN